MESADQIRWSSLSAWFHAIGEFVAEVCTTVSAMIALLVLVALSPKSATRVLDILLPLHRAGSRRLG